MGVETSALKSGSNALKYLSAIGHIFHMSEYFIISHILSWNISRSSFFDYNKSRLFPILNMDLISWINLTILWTSSNRQVTYNLQMQSSTLYIGSQIKFVQREVEPKGSLLPTTKRNYRIFQHIIYRR